MTQPLDVEGMINRDARATDIVLMWTKFQTQRNPYLIGHKDKRNFIFGVTSDTTQAGETTDWSNRTVLPKLTQIRDNLHANYMSALLPNDSWFKWERHSDEEGTIKKQETIQAYMSNKVRIGDFRRQVSQLVFDYIDYGNAFADVTYENEIFKDPATDESFTGFVGPKIIRINPLDIVFDLTATSFRNAPKIVRTLHTMGSFASKLKNEAEQGWVEGVLDKMMALRSQVSSLSHDDFNKVDSFQVDGFGNLFDYLATGQVEVLEFEGDIYDHENGVLLENQLISIVDRTFVARQVTNPAWNQRGFKEHVGWRLRDNNLWAMGPLDNLVALQHAVDKLNNGKLDALDLNIFPRIIAVGDVEPESLDMSPRGITVIRGSGRVVIDKPDISVIAADREIQYLMDQMEQMAGAPREAMGLRSPGEKTAFEVSSLVTAAGRIFQEKVDQFEIELLEPTLNNMLETAKRNISGQEIVRVQDNDLGVERFLTITRDDITSSGKLRPIGARHFSQDAQTLQAIQLIMNSNVAQIIAPHISGKKLAKAVEELTGIDRFDIVRDNAAVFEAGESQRLIREDQAAQDVESGVQPGDVEDEQEPVQPS